MPFELIHKPTFTNQLLALPVEYLPQVIAKIEILRQDPAPYHSVKKKLHGYKGDIYRLRSGDFRIIYRYGDGWVALLGVDRRADVYKAGRVIASDDDVTIDPATVGSEGLERAPIRAASFVAITNVGAASQPLPITLDAALLAQLRVEPQYVAALLACKTEDDLLNVNIPQDVCSRVIDAIFPRDYEQIAAQQPDLITGEPDNLLRYKEGTLLGFLLRLSPAQEKYVTWGLNASGPTLLKGGPGTGKSTVALYRAREFVRALRRAGIASPHILFTTYTNALVSYSKQLLRELLGPDADCVDVQTADSVAMAIVRRAGGAPQMASNGQLRDALGWTLQHTTFAGDDAQQEAQQRAVERLGVDYLLEEIGAVIEGRQITSLAEYLLAMRPGRRVPLNATQRSAVWSLYEQLQDRMAQMRLFSWQQLHASAATLVMQGQGPEPYDAVLIDEAQDLDPSLLRMLVGLCSGPNRLFLAADANQTIYGAGFTWSDVHENLRFRGRTSILRTNFRTTREISEASRSYLSGGALDLADDGADYAHEGPLPTVRACASGYDECELLAQFLSAAARHVQLSRSACAVLTPTEEVGKQIAVELTRRGLPARFMSGRDLDLGAREIKTLTLKSAKGLEFPIVALAGFMHSPYPWRPANMPEEAWEETLGRERRTIYVAMTRAMRALLVSVPLENTPVLLTGFDPTYWNIGEGAAT